MIIQEDTVFVSGLPPSADTKEIAEFFGKIGILKVCIYFFFAYSKQKLPEICDRTFTYFIPHKRNGKKYLIFFNFSLPDKIM